MGTHVSVRRVALTLVLALAVLLPGGHRVATASPQSDVYKSLRIPDPDVTQILTLVDGTSLVGRITFVGEGEIRFMTELGEVTIPVYKVKEIREVSSSAFKDGSYWFPNPNRTRLYFGPTARMLSGGSGYFSSFWIFFPSITYGVTGNISLSAGGSIFPGIGIENQLFFGSAKVGVAATEQIHLAVGAMAFRLPDLDDDDNDDDSIFSGFAYGVATFGTEDLSATAGLGYGYTEDELADKPAVLLGGEWRFARRLSLVTENWVIPGADDPLITYGLRFFGEKMAADLGFATILGGGGLFPGIPLVGFVWNF